MTSQPEPTGISVRGTSLTAEETAAMLAVINTQLVPTPPTEPAVDHSIRNRVVSAWAPVTTWQSLPQGG